MPTKTATKRTSTNDTFSADEKAAMREAAAERRKAKAGNVDGTPDVLAKIAEMPDDERALGEKLHALIMKTVPEMQPRTWYGMPAYYSNGEQICFFQPASKFKARYLTLGFSDKAQLDDGNMWPTSYAITKLTSADESKIKALITKAVG
ncbi:MAG: DUF1801 domain-containing protein [Chloroflexota bacterium]